MPKGDGRIAARSASDGRRVGAQRSFLNLGTNRRWSVLYDKMKEVIDSGELGALKTLIVYHNGTLLTQAAIPLIS